jgi:membrane protease YdiL (CAAX protease family)
MLFLLKRRWDTSLAALLVLTAVGLGLRGLAPNRPPFDLSLHTIAIGIGVCTAVLASDVLLHGLLTMTFGERYLRRQRELMAVFRGQTLPAIFAGSLLAGVGEELVFRGLDSGPVYLGTAAVVFGLLHHIRVSLWPFTVWAIYEGLLFALALYWTEALAVTMTAHSLHDASGFLVFRRLACHQDSGGETGTTLGMKKESLS